MINLIDLSGKRILITGASQGIGQGTAVLLSKLGAKLVLIARNQKKLEETMTMLEGSGHSYYVLDISEIDNIESCVKKIISDQGLLDGMVYCAGLSVDRPIQFINYKVLNDIMKVNLYGFIEFVKCISKKRRYNPGMRIVGISSIAAFIGDKTHTIYSCSKAALDGAVRCMAKELADKNICINTVAPAMIQTPMCDNFIMTNGKEALDRIITRQYLGLGTVQDVANAIAFLISPSAKFITGICLPVDGGATSN